MLSHLRQHQCNVSSLHLEDCQVIDQELIEALVTSKMDLPSLAALICSSQDQQQSERPAMSSLKHLSVWSSGLTLGGTMILLKSLRGLQTMQCSWNCPVSAGLLLLHQMCPQMSPLALSVLDIGNVTPEVLNTLVTLCPKLERLMVEGADSQLTSFCGLSRLSQLSSLTLRLLSEELVMSAVTEVGSQLVELTVEYEEFKFHPFSLESVSTIQRECCQLQLLELLNVNIETDATHSLTSSRKVQSSLKADYTDTRWCGLRRKRLRGSVGHPKVLKQVLNQSAVGGSLEELELHVNKEALTDQVLTSFISTQHLQHLSTVILGAGSLSLPTFTSLFTLPSLTQLSLRLNDFPFISETAFKDLQQDLAEGNYSCTLQDLSTDS